MIRTRSVPEDRIKVLETYQELDDLTRLVDAEVFMQRELIRNAGIEIASKLMEFHKVKKTVRGGKAIYHFRVEVIVPETPK